MDRNIYDKSQVAEPVYYLVKIQTFTTQASQLTGLSLYMEGPSLYRIALLGLTAEEATVFSIASTNYLQLSTN